MDATRGRPGSCDSSWDDAEQLAMEIAAGGRLPESASPVLLEDGEVLHGSGGVEAWRFEGMDVPYVRHRGFAVGGLFTFGLTAAATAAANRRARAEAERLAAPQWRPLGVVEVLATSHRLLVLHNGSWTSVWYKAIRQIRPSLEQDRLELLFDEAPPYLLVGPAVPYLAVVVATALALQVGTEAVAATLMSA